MIMMFTGPRFGRRRGVFCQCQCEDKVNKLISVALLVV